MQTLTDLLKRRKNPSLLESLQLQLDLFIQSVENKTEDGFVSITTSQVVFLNSLCSPQTVDPTLSVLLSQITQILINDNSSDEVIDESTLALTFLEKTPIEKLLIKTKQKWELPKLTCKQLVEFTIDYASEQALDIFFAFLKQNTTWDRLQKFKLSHSSLTRIPENIFNAVNFPKLKKLDLSYNQIAVLENIRERPMDCLDVRSNAIEFVDIQFVGSISQLIIDDNLLTSLDGCRPFFNLQSLSVRNNSIESFQNMKRAFSKLYSLAIINLIGNPVVSDEHFVEKVSDLLPAKQFGIRCYVNGNVVDQNSHKFVNTKTPKPADDAIQTERKNIALSLLDDDAILQSIIDKVERFRNGSWDYTEEEYCKERAFLTELSQQVNKALIETQYSLAPDVEIYPHSSIKEELNKALIQNAFCRREKRTFIEVSGVKDIGMSLVATIPVSSSRGVKIVLEKMVEAANELVTDEESLVLDNDLFGMEIQLQKLVDKGVSESIISNVSEHNSDTESQNDKEDKPLDTDQNDEKKPVESVDNGESNTEEEELVE